MILLSNEDNMKLMSRYPNGHFDIAIIDPEYGQGASKPSKKPNLAVQRNGTVMNVKHKVYKHKDWDDKPAGKEFFDEVRRVSKHQIIWGVNNYDYIFGKGRIVWDKMNGESDQYGCEIAYCSLNNRTDIVHYMWAGMFQGIYCGLDIRKALIQQGNKKLNEERGHPTQKPILLYKWLLDRYVQKGWKILDTNYGYGSIGIACHDYGYDLTACELDKEIYEVALQCLTNHQKQLTMF
jgi:site-specific DNA-methyltransferase (adenine-specific)